MKNITAILFLALLLSVQTPVGQLLKIPILIEHFTKHQKQDGVSLIDFLDEHYSSSHNDSDRTEDEQLPFKSNTFNALSFALLPDLFKTMVFLPLLTLKKITFPATYIAQQHLGSIFHPPRA